MYTYAVCNQATEAANLSCILVCTKHNNIHIHRSNLCGPLLSDVVLQSRLLYVPVYWCALVPPVLLWAGSSSSREEVVVCTAIVTEGGQLVSPTLCLHRTVFAVVLSTGKPLLHMQQNTHVHAARESQLSVSFFICCTHLFFLFLHCTVL